MAIPCSLSVTNLLNWFVHIANMVLPIHILSDRGKSYGEELDAVAQMANSIVSGSDNDNAILCAVSCIPQRG